MSGIIRCDGSYHERKERIAFVMQTNTVVKTVFGFLSLEDIKACRFVCRDWKAISEPILRKRSKIVFDCKSGRIPSGFSTLFAFPYVSMNFTAFSFSKGYWPVSMIDKFMKEQQRNIRELEFDNITLIRDMMNVKNPCISDWIATLPLRKLSVLCSKPSQSFGRDWECNPVVNLDAMKYVPEIILDSVKIKVNPGEKITPTSIKLNFVAIHNKYGKILEEFCINDLIDFKSANNIEITCPQTFTSNCGGTKLKLKLGECPKLTQLKLTETVVENLGADRCSFESLYLDGVPFFGKKNTKVERFSYQCSTIDLAEISSLVEEIYLYSYCNSATIIHSTQPILFRNLKSLHLFGAIAKGLYHFTSSPNLHELYIGGHHDFIFKLKFVPESVKRIHLGLVKNIEMDTMKPLEVDLLVLDSYSFDEAEKVLQKIKPQTLVLENQFTYDEYCHDAIPFIRKFKDVKNIYLGPLLQMVKKVYTWGESKDLEDKKLTFFLFGNHRGRVISKEQFESQKIATPI